MTIEPSSSIQEQPGSQMERETETEAENGAPSVLAALQTFKATQERRVATWSEYQDAIKVHLNSALSNDNVKSQNEAGERRTKDIDQHPFFDSSSSSPQPQPQPGCSHSHPSEHNHNHCESQQTINNNVMSEILRLVTSSLLDCAHESRVIQTELETKFQRRDLSNLVGKIQDLENRSLRKVVERDQLRKIGQLRKEGKGNGNGNDDKETEMETEMEVEEREKKIQDEQKIKQLESDINEIKEAIEEEMMEIRAEIAELEAES